VALVTLFRHRENGTPYEAAGRGCCTRGVISFAPPAYQTMFAQADADSVVGGLPIQTIGPYNLCSTDF
jgi:hypothetical protein